MKVFELPELNENFYFTYKKHGTELDPEPFQWISQLSSLGLRHNVLPKISWELHDAG